MKDKVFAELLESVREGSDIIHPRKRASRDFLFELPDVKAIRKKYGLSQSKFAEMLGISLGTLRNWEQGRRKPEGPARILLFVADKHPEAILDTVHSV
jgi:putative transcriptional regulator